MAIAVLWWFKINPVYRRREEDIHAVLFLLLGMRQGEVLEGILRLVCVCFMLVWELYGVFLGAGGGESNIGQSGAK